jgi:hypothetical protein
MSRHFIISICILTIFCILALLVSPKFDVGFAQSLVREDTVLFLRLNAEQQHQSILDEFMILMTQYGRELVWPIFILTYLSSGAQWEKRPL